MIDALLRLPAHVGRRLADALESGQLRAPCSSASLQAVLGLREGEDVVEALGELERLGVAGPASAAWAFELLARRMDEMPELRVTLLLNIQRRRGNTASTDELVRTFANRFWGIDWPGEAVQACTTIPAHWSWMVQRVCFTRRRW